MPCQCSPPFPPIENGPKWLYQLLPIKYELKLPSEVTPGLLPFRSRSKQCEQQKLMEKELKSNSANQPISARKGGMSMPCQVSPQKAPCAGFQFFFHNVLLHYQHHISKNWRPIFPCYISGLLQGILNIISEIKFSDNVQNFLHCYRVIIIFDLRGYGGCWRPKTFLRRPKKHEGVDFFEKSF